MNTKRKFRKLIGVLLIALMFVLAGIQPVKAATTNQYFLAFLYNEQTKTFASSVVQDGSFASRESNSSLLSTNLTMFEVQDSALMGFYVPGRMAESTLTPRQFRPYNFPEFSDAYAQSDDYTQALVVGEALTGALNTAISYVLKPVSTAGREELGISKAMNYFQLARYLSNSAYTVVSGNTISYREFSYAEKLKWSIRQATADDAIKGIPSGSTFRDYVVIKYHGASEAQALVVPYLFPKGYSTGQALDGDTTTQLGDESTTEKLSWGHVVYLTEEHYSLGSTFQNQSSLKNEDLLSKMLGNFFVTLIKGIEIVLGIASVESLMFNAGVRGATYYYGTMPMSWTGPINTLNLIATIISLIVIGVSIIKMLIQRNMATITPAVRADLMDNVKDLFIVVLGILLFMPALTIMLNFNSLIVAAMRNLAPSGNGLGLATGGGALGIWDAIVQLAYIFVLVVLNVNYLVRAITLAILIGFAPFFISLFAAGGASKKISVTWMKELLSNIFMQTFNAAILLLFLTVSQQGTLTVLERFALLISFIPLTKFFKTSLMNLGSGSDAVGEKTGSSLVSMGTAFAAGALGAVMDGKAKGKNGGKAEAKADGGIKSNTAESSLKEGADDKAKLKGGVGESIKQSADAAKDKIARAGKYMWENKGQVAKDIAVGGATMAGAAATSLGSAAGGGQPTVGIAPLLFGAQHAFNSIGGGLADLETAGVAGENELSIASGSELSDMGISGFDNGMITLSNELKADINSDTATQLAFKKNVEMYNQNVGSDNEKAKVEFDSSGKNIIGVKIAAVAGETKQIRNPEDMKFLTTESAYYGKKHLDEFHSKVISQTKYAKEKKFTKDFMAGLQEDTDK